MAIRGGARPRLVRARPRAGGHGARPAASRGPAVRARRSRDPRAHRGRRTTTSSPAGRRSGRARPAAARATRGAGPVTDPPTTDLPRRRHPARLTPRSGRAPTARACSRSCAPSGRCRSTRSPSSSASRRAPASGRSCATTTCAVSRATRAVHLGPRLQHRRPADRAARVLRLDDQHGRAAPHQAAPARQPRLHAAHGGARSRRRCASRRASIVDDGRAEGRVRLRRRDRRGAAAADHLRHDGHPRRPTTGACSSSPTSSSASAIPSTRTTIERADGGRRWSCRSTPRRSARSASRSPRDDITSALMHAEVDGERLTTQEFGVVLHPAGRRRQRDHAQRDQPRHEGAHRLPRPARATGMADFERVAPTAVEEIVRWATPVIHFRRTATRDTELGGQAITRGREGRAVVQLGQPRRARRSPTRIASTSRRTPNEHVGFGGGGAALLPRAPTWRGARSR